MEFRILGPLEALDERGVVRLGGGKQRALLAVFLLHANEALTTDRLIDELWGERPPATAAKTLQVYISRLRKALGGREGGGAGMVATREHGYVLELDPDRLDAHRFEGLLAEGRSERAAGYPERAAAALERALSLWRGPCLADMAYEPFAQREIARLDDLRVAALEQLAEAKLALGAHAEVIGPLERLIGEHPYRERLRAHLMLALYRSDRQADALQAYQEARRTLVEDLGIEPGERLRELEGAILAQDPGLHLAAAEPPAAEPVPEPPSSPFVGREPELALLAQALGDAMAGHGRLVLLAGEPGIGKSRLAEELTAQAQVRGAQVLVGRCWEAGGAPAYWPWVQSLRSYVRASDPPALRSQLGASAAEVAHIVPELRQLFADLPHAETLDSEGARVRLFDATTAFLKRAAADRPLVLVLDDLHAADAPSLLLLQFLARELRRSRLLLLGLYRDVDPIVGEPLAGTLVELAREPTTERVRLGAFGELDVTDYMRQAAGMEPAPEMVRAIYGNTEGNPLFVAELLRLLDAEGRLGHADTELRIPPGVRGVIARRVGRLSEPCRDLLALACVLGREFELRVLGRLGELSDDELLEVLDEAMSERVVGGVPSTRDRLRFEHALIRDTLYDNLSAARRLQLHRRAGEALEAVYADRLEPRLSELAHHFYAAAPGVEEKALDYARRAGDRAVSVLAYEDAVHQYQLALTLVEDERARSQLLIALGEARARAGDTAASKQSFREAVQLAERGGLGEELARAALGYGGRLIWEPGRDDEEWLPLLERALAALGPNDSSLRVRLLARLAGGPLREASFSAARRKSLSDEAVEMARRVGDPDTLAYALDAYIPANESPENVPEMLALADELLSVAREVGDKERLLEGHEHRLGRLLELGEKRDAQAALAAMAKLAEELRQPAQWWLLATCEARMALLEGRLAEAEQLIARAVTHGESVHHAITTTCSRLQLYLLRREQGRLAEVTDLVVRSVDEYPSHPLWRCVHAQMAAELGHESEARRAFEALATDDFAGLPFQEMWLVTLGFLAEAAAALGDTPRAAILYGLLLPYADRVAVSYPEACTGAVARYLGILAATMSLSTAAERHFECALEINERIGARPWRAHTQRDYARMLTTRHAKDGQKAQRLLADALATYRALGMEAHAEKARALTRLR